MFFKQFITLVILCCPLVFCKERGVVGTATCLALGCVDLTEAAQKLYPKFVKGSRNWKSSEVLRFDYLHTSLTTVTYTVRNATFSGFGTCKPILVRMFEKSSTYDYQIECKHLTYKSGHYEAYGKLGNFNVEGNGTSRHDYQRYVFKLNGQYLKFSDRNNVEHVRLLNYILNIEAKGKVVYDYNGLFNGDRKKGEALMKFINSHSKMVDSDIRQPLMSKFMEEFLANQNDYHANTALSDYTKYQ